MREVAQEDLPIFFEHQLDPTATAMAAFPSRDREAFMAHWVRILQNETGVLRTIVCNGRVAGNVVSWPSEGKHLVGYWVGREHWGQGVATAALRAFLEIVDERPLHAFVARHNAGSIRVLEKCGFIRCGEDAEEFEFRLDSPAG